MDKKYITSLLFCSVCLIWGTTWLAMEIAVDTIPPIFSTALRFLIASPILVILSKIFKQPLMFPKGKRKWTLLVAVFYFAIPFTLMIAGEMYISSGLASIIFANMPIAVMIMSTLFLGLRLTRQQFVGLLIAIISLYVILSNELGIGGDNLLIGSAALALAVIIHAVMYVMVQKNCKDIEVITYNALPSFIASILLLITSFAFEQVDVQSFSASSLIAVAYLGVFASVGGIVAYFKLGQVSTPFAASICFLIFPLVALALSAVTTGNIISEQSLYMLIPLLSGILLTKISPQKLSLKRLTLLAR
ncbi:DMT family transporter [Psychromonas sp. Urea-02u-13]|uniref:DMT family transporter n=1 Tax=Psychromonas sp. Urea-02u-13 TaxID=2058326 RepID=UPI000C343975|nr:DMT family transporter [Psychromonas sp. Urea-02u-13]PKG37666.1 EamA family transporter [Psychromonas sp. Urea-02u-13]